MRRHFSSYTVKGRQYDHAEDEWGRLEDQACPLVRQWIDGKEMPASRDAAKVLAALHFGRSYGFRAFYDWIAAEHRTTAITEFAADREMRRRWRKDFGADPKPGEAEAVIAERFDAMVGARSPFVIERMANAYNVALEKLEPLHVQAMRPIARSLDFIAGDTPFVYFDGHRERVGAQSRLALGDAEHLYMPLSPRLSVMFTTTPLEDAAAPSAVVQELNILVWRAAFAQVACHPPTDLSRALAMSL